MFSTLDDALSVLEARKNRKLGIEGLLEALPHYQDPHETLTCIHIGGTNGKGSTTDFTRAILETAGYRVGSFTSPHLISHNDRIRINNEPISDKDLLDYINQTQPIWNRFGLSMFEIDMLISLLYFQDQGVDVCIYEVGLGGRLDATNVIKPLITAVTHVDFDHMSTLGTTLPQIAYEKAGIIKEGIPFLTMETKEDVKTVFRTVSEQKQAPYIEIAIPNHVLPLRFMCLGIEINLYNQPIYQVENATLAIHIARLFDPQISDDIIQSAIQQTHWAGRFEEIIPHVYLDGAHNMNGVMRLAESLSLLPKPWTMLFTALKDKEYKEMVSLLEQYADTLIITEFSFERAESAENLAKGHDCIVIPDFRQAIEYGLKHRNDGTFLITGSLYFISEARQYLQSRMDQ